MVAAGAGTALRPVLGLLSTATITPLLKEFSIYNTTATACQYRLVNFTGGTPGAGQTERRLRRNAPPALCLVSGLWTVDAVIGEDLGYNIQLPAAVGGGAIVPIIGASLEGELGPTSGIGLVPVGTGQICVVNFAWDES